MKRVVIILLAGLLFSLTLSAEVTIEECVEKALANYPIVKNTILWRLRRILI